MPVIHILLSVLGTVLTPAVLLFSSVCFLRVLPCRDIFHPALFWKTVCGQSAHPFRSLSLALAGTLGVGNIIGVASALILGGPGAVFWMWIGAVIVLPVKYAEVYLAVRYRKKDTYGWYGGAMYYIRDGLAARHSSPAFGTLCASGFAVLCFLNAYVTGNLMQAHAAAALFPQIPSVLCGIFLAVFLGAAIVYGVHRLEQITSFLIPFLSILYVGICLVYIVRNRVLLPRVLHKIVVAAFSSKVSWNNGSGYAVWQGIRYGIMRGIFSNEAGCGTSPTAHAAADTKSPHHQAVLGVMEVLFDTIILCSFTAFVLLLAVENGFPFPWHGDDTEAAAAVLRVFREQCGSLTEWMIRLSVFLFAFSTMLAQLYYGSAALQFLTKNKQLQSASLVLAPAAAVLGSVLPAPSLWMAADFLLGSMTTVNCLFLIFLRKDCRDDSLHLLRKS